MALKQTHTGWENEHLATYLLSRIAFVARPVTVADDVGTDLFCTLFEIRDGTRGQVLVPLSSIAIQVKSSCVPLDVSSKIAYLERLEMPYYIGVVSQATLTLSLYSARYLPNIMSARKSHKTILVPVDKLGDTHRSGDYQTGYQVRCPLVTTLSATDSRDALQTKLNLIREDASDALTAVASRMNNEFIFQVPGGFEIFTGPDSARTFRENFHLRLAEALHNFAWLLETQQPVSSDEINRYLAVYDVLSVAGSLPKHVSLARERLIAVHMPSSPTTGSRGPAEADRST